MARIEIDGVKTVYEIIGVDGPVVTVMPGGRRGYLEMRGFGEKLAAHGFRVFMHDRRNTGAADMRLEDKDTEEGVWADEMHALLDHLGLLPAYISGASSGARTAINFALRYPNDLKGLIAMRVTGGDFAAKRLPQNYYRVYIETAERGGMEAVCATDRFVEYISINPQIRDQLMAMDPRDFIAVQSNLLDKFLAGASLPVMGVTEAQLGTIKVPTLIIPGNDNTHSSRSGEIAHQMINGSQIYRLPIEDVDADLVGWPDWNKLEDEIAGAYAKFIKSVEASA